MKFAEATIQAREQNIAWVNNLRLIAMFAVVILHTASPLLFQYNKSPLQQWLVADVYNALVRFAVPVFVMITGALLLHREYELGDFLKKRLGRLILPFIFWSLVYIVYRWYNEDITFTNNTWANIKQVLQLLQTGSFYHLWYVYLLVGLYLFIPVISKFVRHATEKELLYFLAVWFLTILISKPYLAQFNIAFDLRYFTGYIGYLVLGHYLAYKTINFWGLLLVSTLVFISFAFIIAAGTHYLEVKDHELSTYFYEPIGPFVIILSASAFLMAKCTTVKLNAPLRWISNHAGKYTLGIYLSHALILSSLDLIDINSSLFIPALSIPLVALLCFALSWLLIWIMSKLPLLKHVTG
ncbi:acyltransferase [Mucilaginibacter sp. SP1R1]|uniref:acyltransferase n=1 Tax=Mucilaginibacter sp. SP1R1 TaxID=2723091 RepID=UPI0016158355|nr:acyltransferase family protein [Mucilaginibacter sp. SP1R1]MBB6148575.1 surface polysaccharide O-acyltransferase-like enzyme [Mucilaginibacter sp. SP1R1]